MGELDRTDSETVKDPRQISAGLSEYPVAIRFVASRVVKTEVLV